MIEVSKPIIVWIIRIPSYFHQCGMTYFQLTTLPRHLNSNLRVLVKVLLWQTQNVIVQALCRLIVATAVREKYPRVEQLGKAHHIPLLQRPPSVLFALPCIFLTDFPNFLASAGHAHDRSQHVFLADIEGRNV